jgi:glycosyltransferase involved in cell wall biosynthesis
VPEYIAAFDVAVQPGVPSYACPLKLIEYMALGKAIVAPRSPSIEEVLEDDCTGLLFDAGDERSLSASLDRLRGSDELRVRLGSAARRHVIENRMTWRHNAQCVIEMFQEVKREAEYTPASAPGWTSTTGPSSKPEARGDRKAHPVPRLKARGARRAR